LRRIANGIACAFWIGMHWDQAQSERHNEREMMRNNQHQGTHDGDGNRPRLGDRRKGSRRAEDLERRLAEVEEVARANRRELHLQFQRMAHMQADLDRLMKSTRSLPPTSGLPYETKGFDRDGSRTAVAHDARVPPAPRRRRA